MFKYTGFFFRGGRNAIFYNRTVDYIDNYKKPVDYIANITITVDDVNSKINGFTS